MFQVLVVMKGDIEKVVKFFEDGGNLGVVVILLGVIEGVGGVIILCVQVSELIELFCLCVVVCVLGVWMIDMFVGQMCYVWQSFLVIVSYIGENVVMFVSESGFDKVDQSFKKLIVLVFVGNLLL